MCLGAWTSFPYDRFRNATVFRPTETSVRVIGFGRAVDVPIRPREHPVDAFRRVAFAWARAEVTALPGYREVLDTLRWEEL